MALPAGAVALRQMVLLLWLPYSWFALPSQRLPGPVQFRTGQATPQIPGILLHLHMTQCACALASEYLMNGVAAAIGAIVCTNARNAGYSKRLLRCVQDVALTEAAICKMRVCRVASKASTSFRVFSNAFVEGEQPGNAGRVRTTSCPFAADAVLDTKTCALGITLHSMHARGLAY